MDDLFTYKSPLVGRDHPETSHAAAAAIAPMTGRIRREVYSYAVERGSDGFTDQELFDAFPDAPDGSYRMRRVELVESGYLKDTGERRLNSRNRHVVVWALATLGGEA